MQRIGTPDGLYHNKDVLAGEAGTVVDAGALNSIQEEIISVITAAGIQLNAASNGQLLEAIQAITGAGLSWGAIQNKPSTLANAASFTAGSYLVGADANPIALKTPSQVLTDIGAAPLASPGLTGTPTAPTAVPGTNTVQVANTAYVMAAVNQGITTLINGSPAVLATLHALADALGDDAHFATTVTNNLAGKVTKAGDTMTGEMIFSGAAPIQLSGTGATGSVYIHGMGGAGDNMATITRAGASSYTWALPALTVANNAVWHAGNFNPANYLPLAGGHVSGLLQMTNGTASAPQIQWLDSVNNTVSAIDMTAETMRLITVYRGGSGVAVIQISAQTGAVQFYKNVAATNYVATPPASNPANGVNTFAFVGNGSYGGGYGMIDGSNAIGMHSVNGNLNFSFGANTGALTSKAQIDNAGNITCLGQMKPTGGFQDGSSRTIKTGLRELGYGLADLLKIETKRGRYKKSYNPDGRTRLFLIAEQLLEIIPEAVIAQTEGPTPYTVEFNQLIPVLIASLSEVDARLKTLEKAA